MHAYKYVVICLCVQNQHRYGNTRVAYAEYVDVQVYGTTVRLAKEKRAYVRHTTHSSAASEVQRMSQLCCYTNVKHRCAYVLYLGQQSADRSQQPPPQRTRPSDTGRT